jgi:hypothetical protein
MTPTITLLVAGLALITLGYVGRCYAKPFGKCVACRISPGDHFCRRCNGTGLRPRIGWQLYHAFRRVDSDAHAGEHRPNRHRR